MNNSKKPKIGILTERMTLGYGVDVVIHEQAVRLVQRGYSVTVFTAWKTGFYDDQPYRIVPLAEECEGIPDFFSLKFLLKAFDIINKHDIEIWIIHTPPFYFWFHYFRVPVIMVEHGTPPGKYFKYRQGKRLDKQTRKRHRKVFRNLRPGDGLIAISEYIRSELPADIQKRTKVIYNGADHYSKASQQAIDTFRKAADVKSDETLVVWVGRIQPRKDQQPYKGLGQLLRLGRKIQSEKCPIRLVAVGRGDESVEPLLRNAGIIPFLNQSRESMAAVYAGADIFLNTSKWEGFNLPLVEAQFQGTPVIALNVCAHPEVVADGFSGILVNSYAELLPAIVKLANDPELRKQLSIGAVRHAADFSWDSNVDKLEKLIQCSMKVYQSLEPAEPPKLELNKNLKYYKDYAEYLIFQFGWKTFVKECFGWGKRRLPWKKRKI